MQPAVDRPFEGFAEFHQAVIEVLDASRRELVFVDHDFQSWPLGTVAGEQALRGALKRGAHLRLMVVKPGWLQRHGDRFQRVRREFAAQVAVREVPESLRVEESALLADGQHLVRRAHHEARAGRIIRGMPSALEPLLPRYQSIWDESAECLPATTLGL